MFRIIGSCLLGVLIVTADSDTSRAAPDQLPLDQLPIVKAVPETGRLLEASGMAKAKAPAALGYVSTVLNGLMLDVETPLLDNPRSLQQALLAAATVQMLEARGEASPDLRLKAVYAAYLLYLIGHGYERDPLVRRAIDSLPGSAQDATTRALLQDLAKAAPKLRKFAASWLPNAATAALRDDKKLPPAHNLMGHFLLREGRLDQARDAFERAQAAEPHFRYALNIYRVLVEQDQHDSPHAQELVAFVTKRAPGLAAYITKIASDRADRRATERFEAPDAKPPVADQAAQVGRYLRQGERDKADAVVKALLAQHPDKPAARHAAAEAFLVWGRYDDLVALFATAEPLDRRLLEVRIAAVARTRLAHIQRRPGQHPISEADLEADLQRYEQIAGAEGKRVALTTRVLLDVARGLAAGDEVPAELVKAIEAQATAGVAAHPGASAMVDLAVGALVSVADADAALALLGKLHKKARAKPQKAYIRFLQARLEAGYGVRRGDPALLDRAIGRLEKLDPAAKSSLIPAPLHAYTQVSATLARAALDGKASSFGPHNQPGAAKLVPLLDAFDPDAATGSLLAQATALSFAALAFARDDNDVAHRAMQRARLVRGDVLGVLASGQAAVVRGDPGIAHEILAPAVAGAGRPGVQFAYHKWLALIGHRLGEKSVVRQHMTRMVELWDEAKRPAKADPAVPCPVLIGDFDMTVALAPGEPLQPIVRMAPVIVLLPDFQHDKAEVQAILAQLAGP